MSKVLDRKSKRYYKTGVSADDSEVFRLTGDRYERDAKAEFLSGNYRQSFSDHRNAARCYKGALDKLGSSSKDIADRKNIEAMYLVARTEGRKAALYKATEKTPLLFRGLMRKIKGRHILSSFVLSLFFSFPNLTGNIVGVNARGFISFLGAIFFFTGIFIFYFYVLGKVLVNKMS